MLKKNFFGMGKLRIAIVTELYFPHTGGQEYRYFELSRELAKLGHEVHVFAIQHDKRLPREEELGKNAFVHRYAYVKNYVRPGWRSLLGVIKYSGITAFKLLNERFDFYLFNQWPLLHIFMAEPFCKSITVVDWCELWYDNPVHLAQKIISHFSDAHTAVSNSIRTRLVEQFGVPRNKVKVIPSGVTVCSYNSNVNNKETGNVVYVGRLVPHKHVDMIIEAVKIAHAVHKEINLDILGDGPMRNLLLDRAKGCEDFIKIHGWVTEEKKRKMLQRAWTFALLSEREGFPRTVAEAMASGTPTITANYPINGACDVVRNYRSGIVVPPNPREVGELLVRLFNNREWWTSLAENCLASVDELDWKTVTKKLESFIKEMLLGDENR